MVEVRVESIRVSLMNQQRLVLLREKDGPRFLPIWIGPAEADAITLGLQHTEVERPLTHDLLRGAIEQLGATVNHVIVSELADETYFARIVVTRDGETIEIDSRSSDAIALAVRVEVPIYVADAVMAAAGQLPSTEGDEPAATGARPPAVRPAAGEEEDGLDVFRDFFEELDLGDFGPSADPED